MAFCLAFSLVLLVGQVNSQFEVPRDQTVPECSRKASDIFFILDSSTSIYINDYRQVLQFARDVVARLDISPAYTRVGLLTFSDDITRPVVELNRYQTKSDLLAAINEQNLPYRTGITNTDTAINHVRESQLFREDVTKTIIVITDGGSRSPGSTTREAELARENGFYVFVIGMGQYQVEREWRNIASDPDSSFVFNTTYSGLDQVRDILPQRACVLPPLGIVVTCNVQRNTEVFFVAGPSGTSSAVQIIDKFVEATQGTASFVRVSYLLGICSAAENVPVTSLDRFCDRSQFVGIANANTYVQLLTRLRTIARQSRGRGAKQVAVLFLDEETLRLNRAGLISEARNVGQVDDVEIVVVDLGTRIYTNTIQGIASRPENIITFNPGPVASQRSALTALINRTCQAINGVTSPTLLPVNLN